MSETLSSFDDYLFHEGTHDRAYRLLGAHLTEDGCRFSLWAPGARYVRLLSGRTGWDTGLGMEKGEGGIWHAFVKDMGANEAYRYAVEGADGVTRQKSDPYAFYAEKRPQTASLTWPLDGYQWHDDEWQAQRDVSKVLSRPMSAYEVYLGSWKKEGPGPDGFLNYRQYADQLCDYVGYMGYTHVELMGICEFPLDASWGYQVTGFFAPTGRYGTPDDFRYLVDRLHQCGVGVILDWVPAHFPKDDFGLRRFDGTPLYEFADPLRAEYPEWGTMAFDHGKPEVRSFLISSAYYWITEFHVDALRVDAVAAMFHNNFGRREWRPNKDGGSENLESTAFLKQLNQTIRKRTTGYLIAEDSSIVKNVTFDVDEGGVGFLFKWNMGWMNETLRYIREDPVFRKWHHGTLTHSVDYAFFENFVLVLSHDEVVHGKGSMLSKQQGGIMARTGGLKTMYTYQFTHPGKKLLFMGQDIAMEREWDENRQIDWELTEEWGHRDIMECVRRLNAVYRRYPVLYSDSRNPVTFEWINRNDADRNIISFIRRNPWNYEGAVLVVCNFSPMAYGDYTFGVPLPGYYKRVFSTFDGLPGGGGTAEAGDLPPMEPEKHPCDGYPYRLSYGLRPYESFILEFPTGEKR